MPAHGIPDFLIDSGAELAFSFSVGLFSLEPRVEIVDLRDIGNLRSHGYHEVRSSFLSVTSISTVWTRNSSGLTLLLTRIATSQAPFASSSSARRRRLLAICSARARPKRWVSLVPRAVSDDAAASSDITAGAAIPRTPNIVRR